MLIEGSIGIDAICLSYQLRHKRVAGSVLAEGGWEGCQQLTADACGVAGSVGPPARALTGVCSTASAECLSAGPVGSIEL